MALAFPNIDPVAFAVGPLEVRWYSLAYLAGIVFAYFYMKVLNRKVGFGMTAKNLDDFVLWATLGIVFGGRLGYVLFYNFPYFMQRPADILKVWQGGMSFHGGLIGVILAIIGYGLWSGKNLYRLADLTVLVTPVGLFFGRIANFINGELFGRVAPDAPLAMVFPRGGPLPRHPSQLYEAAAEGLLLFLVLNLLWWFRPLVRNVKGLTASLFLLGYALARIAVENYREPDGHIGFVGEGLSMGQALSYPLIAGFVLIAGLAVAGYRKERKAGTDSDPES